MIFDHIIETGEWLYELVTLLSGPDVFFVGLYCSLSDLERREMQRGDRHPGEARLDFQTVYSIPVYDLQINSENPPEENATQVIQSWRE